MNLVSLQVCRSSLYPLSFTLYNSAPCMSHCFWTNYRNSTLRAEQSLATGSLCHKDCRCLLQIPFAQYVAAKLAAAVARPAISMRPSTALSSLCPHNSMRHTPDHRHNLTGVVCRQTLDASC